MFSRLKVSSKEMKLSVQTKMRQFKNWIRPSKAAIRPLNYWLLKARRKRLTLRSSLPKRKILNVIYMSQLSTSRNLKRLVRLPTKLKSLWMSSLANTTRKCLRNLRRKTLLNFSASSLPLKEAQHLKQAVCNLPMVVVERISVVVESISVVVERISVDQEQQQDLIHSFSKLLWNRKNMLNWTPRKKPEHTRPSGVVIHPEWAMADQH